MRERRDRPGDMKVKYSAGLAAVRDGSPPVRRAGEGGIHGAGAGKAVDVRAILDALPCYALLVDGNHNILEANDATYVSLGVKPEEILGRYCPKVVHGLDQPFEGCPLEEAAKADTVIERELFDGKTGRWTASAVYPVNAFNPQNGSRIFLHMVTDITDRKLAQEQLTTSREQLRTLSAHIVSVREEEKKGIARDLHDETSQLLASLHAHLAAAIGILHEDADKAEALLRTAQSLSTTVLDEIQRLIYELRPSLLDEFGLVAAIRSLADNRLKAAGLEVSFKITGVARRLPPTLEVPLFRVVQEAFNNVIRHAQASVVKASIRFKKDSIKISVLDNGIGFDVQEAMNPKGDSRGLGLLGMRERIELMKGTLEIKAGSDRGTEITVEIPFSNGASSG
jgi:PAS domain S-box-containing protein